MTTSELPRCEFRSKSATEPCGALASLEPTYLGLDNRPVLEMFLCEDHHEPVAALYELFQGFARSMGDDVSLTHYTSTVEPPLFETLEGWGGSPSKPRRGYRLLADGSEWPARDVAAWLQATGRVPIYGSDNKKRRGRLADADVAVWARAMTRLRGGGKGS